MHLRRWRPGLCPMSRRELLARDAHRAILAAVLAFWSVAACDDSGAAPAEGDGSAHPDGPAAVDVKGTDSRSDVAGAHLAVDSSASSDGPIASRMAACGAPGSACCAGHLCEEGGCCVSGRCLAETGVCLIGFGAICRAGACGECGTLGQACCAGACTGPNTVCVGSVCAHCGAAGEPCCPRSDLDPEAPPKDPLTGRIPGTCTAAGSICQGERCQPCGDPSQPCCGDGSCRGSACCHAGVCVGAGQACGAAAGAPMVNPPGGFCQDGTCSACGGKDQPCCGAGPSASCHAPGQTCKGGRCGSCGGGGEVCCPGAGGPSCSHGFLCTAAVNICEKCGGPGERCCPDRACEQGGCCLGGRCFAEGDSCLSLGSAYGICEAGRCGCGGAGEPCCPGSSDAREPACVASGTACSAEAPGKAGSCVACGGLGAPCCPGQRCTDSGSVCVVTEGGSSTSCQKCGGPGEVCCYGPSPCSSPDTVCSQSTTGQPRRCIRCGTASPASPVGGVQVPCCGGNTCTDGSCCVSSFNQSVCIGRGSSCLSLPGTAAGMCGDNGSCNGCGAAGQPCCAGDSCTASGTQCSSTGGSGTCTACGKSGQPCCKRSGIFDPVTCEGSLKCTSTAGGPAQCTP